jgi:hypothetical protein
MANADRPRGFEPWGKVLRTSEYVAGASIKPGDALVLSSDGKVDPVATGGSAYTSFVLGVAATAAADGEAIQVYDHPDQMYVVQADGADIAAQTDIHLNYGILGTSADTTYDISRMELDSSSGGLTNTLSLKLLRIDKRDDNALGAQVDCVVRINNNQLVADAGSLGV